MVTALTRTGILVVHGMLHLLGYDHIEEEDMNIMRPKEERLYWNPLILQGLKYGVMGDSIV